jgi:hypothetical protein
MCRDRRPGTNYGIVGALGNGDRVRSLRCQTLGSARWCEVEMMTDIRERGWVNGGYLTAAHGVATQLPELKARSEPWTGPASASLTSTIQPQGNPA